MNMMSIGIADFKGCQRSKIVSISLFQVVGYGFVSKRQENSVFARYIK